MKINKILAIISSITLFPFILYFPISFITHYYLYPQEICHQYDGDSFGSAAICDTLPAWSYFGSVIIGMFSPLFFIGIIAVIIYFARIFFHNKKYSSDQWKYSRVMLIFGTFLLIVTFQTVYASINYRNAIYEAEEIFTVATEQRFICDNIKSMSDFKERISIIVQSDATVEQHGAIGSKETLMLNVIRIGKVDNELKTFEFEPSIPFAHGVTLESYRNGLKMCKNIHNESFLDLYHEIPPKFDTYFTHINDEYGYSIRFPNEYGNIKVVDDSFGNQQFLFLTSDTTWPDTVWVDGEIKNYAPMFYIHKISVQMFNELKHKCANIWEKGCYYIDGDYIAKDEHGYFLMLDPDSKPNDDDWLEKKRMIDDDYLKMNFILNNQI